MEKRGKFRLCNSLVLRQTGPFLGPLNPVTPPALAGQGVKPSQWFKKNQTDTLPRMVGVGYPSRVDEGPWFFVDVLRLESRKLGPD